jgi:hypothetical protein
VLVPLVAVATLLALLYWPRGGPGPRHDVQSDVTECAARLRRLHAALVKLGTRVQGVPPGSGTAFLAGPLALGAVDDSPANRAMLTCPGPGAQPVPAGTDWTDLAALGPASSAYAGRDQVAAPLPRFPSGGSEVEVLAACDNAVGMNHDGCMNVLYSDGTVVLLRLADEIAAGRLPPDATRIPVGPGSPLADLARLVGD